MYPKDGRVSGESATLKARQEDALIEGPEMTATEVLRRQRMYRQRINQQLEDGMEDLSRHLAETFHPIKRGSLVGICGRARSGKDTLADGLQQTAGFAKLSFASAIRDFVCRILGCTLEQLEEIKETPQEVLGGKTPRFAMQTLGTEWGRDTLYGNIWVDLCMREAERYLAAGISVVISDVRFDNEARLLAEQGGILFEIQREGTPIAASGHSSEGGIPRGFIDMTIINDGTPVDMLRKALDIL